MKSNQTKPPHFKPKLSSFNHLAILNPGTLSKPKRRYRRIKRIRPRERLTAREALVADLLAEGWNPTRAADCLGLSPERLVYFSHRIRRKLEIKGRTDVRLWELGFGDKGRPPKNRKQRSLE